MANIIILGPAYPLRGGGMATFNERLAKEFMDQGHTVTIFTFSLQYPDFLFPGKTQYADEPPPENLNIEVKVNSINPFNWFKIGREINTIRPDLLIIRYWMPFFSPCLGTIARMVKRNRHTRIIAITDNIIPHERRWFDSMLTKFFIKHIHGFITMSESVRRDLRSFHIAENRISQCPHPLYDNYGEPVSQDSAKNVLEIDADGYLILFFGFIRDYKGLDLLIESFATKRLRELPVKLLVAGEFYTSQASYFSLVKKHELEHKVIWHNHFIYNEMVKYYFSAADLVVQPYRSATQSGVTQIAYHYNIPMIVTRVGGLPEMVPHMKVGYVVDPDPEAISVAIADYFTEHRKKIFQKEMITEKKRFSWSNVTKAIFDLSKLKVESQKKKELVKNTKKN